MKNQVFLIAFLSFSLGLITAFFLNQFFSPPLDSSFFTLISITPIISPNSEDALYSALFTTQKQLDLSLYQFSYSGLKDALIELHQNGVRVRLILEPRVDSNLETASFLASNGIDVRWASLEYTNTHSKLALIDERCVIVGSINWSRAALQTNRETAVFFCDSTTASVFQKTFEEDWAKASPVK